jgi:Domain of unknown function (DUF4129)
VALASRGHRPFEGGGGGGQQPSTAFWDYLFSVALAVGVVGFGVALWALLSARGGSTQDRTRHMRLYGLVFLSALVLGVAISARMLSGDSGTSQQPRPVLKVPRPDSGRTAVPGNRPLQIRWLPIALVGTTVALALAYLVARRRYRLRAAEELTDEQLADELALLVDDTLDDLRAEPDPRRAVIAAYARMERALAAYGLPKRSFEAPLEYLDRIAGELHGRLPSARRLVFELTHLFEQAKFSLHAIDAGMKEDAIATLTRLRDDLRAEPEQAA